MSFWDKWTIGVDWIVEWYEVFVWVAEDYSWEYIEGCGSYWKETGGEDWWEEGELEGEGWKDEGDEECEECEEFWESFLKVKVKVKMRNWDLF